MTEAEFVRKHNAAVITLARQRAKQSVHAQLRAPGLKLAQFPAKEIAVLANAELERNRGAVRR